MGKHKRRHRGVSTSSSSSTEEEKRKRHRSHSKKSKHRHSKRSRRREPSKASSSDGSQRSNEPEPRVVVRPPSDDFSPGGKTHEDSPDVNTVNKSDGEISPSPNEDETLNDILGLMPSKSIQPSDIDTQISARWENIVTTGLSPELRGELLRNYPTPANCPMLTVPKLNAEIEVSLSESLRKKEEGFTTLQAQLSAGLSALGIGLSKALAVRSQNAALIDPWLKNMSDAGRILADLHHEVSLTRQKIVMPVIANPSIRKLAESSGVDKFLFGGDLSEKMKAVKEVEKSSHDLKVKETSGKTKKFTSTSKFGNRSKNYSKHSLNANRPPRPYLQQKTTESGGRQYNRQWNYRQRK